MKIIKNILMVVGLSLQIGVGFAAFSDDRAEEGQAILDNIRKHKSKSESEFGEWKPTGPTREDILAATVENLAAKGSREDKLISAVKNGDLKNVEALIAAGAGLEARDSEDMTALMIAARQGYTDIVSRLINAGTNVDAKDRYNNTPLFHAVDGGHTDIVRILMTAGAASDPDFESIFVSAVFKGNTQMVKALIINAHLNCDILETASMVVNKRNTELFNIIKHLKSQC